LIQSSKYKLQEDALKNEFTNYLKGNNVSNLQSQAELWNALTGMKNAIDKRVQADGMPTEDQLKQQISTLPDTQKFAFIRYHQWLATGKKTQPAPVSRAVPALALQQQPQATPSAPAQQPVTATQVQKMTVREMMGKENLAIDDWAPADMYLQDYFNQLGAEQSTLGKLMEFWAKEKVPQEHKQKIMDLHEKLTKYVPFVVY